MVKSNQERGVIVGCDSNLEWILPWWWKHYSAFNSYPVLFVDFGLSKEAAAWCRKRGECEPLSSAPSDCFLKEHVSSKLKRTWEKRFGADFWIFRTSWLKKPYAFLLSPFPNGLWLDLDCQIKGDLDPIFNSLSFGIELALARDSRDDLDYFLPGEVHYNSGVVAFRKEADILYRWIEALFTFKDLLPGDQDYLSRAIFTHKTPVFELPPIYNWSRIWGPNEDSIIYHFCGGFGKVEILKMIGASAFSNPKAPKFWKKIAKDVSTFLR